MVPSTFSRLKAARCLPVVLAALIFAGCGTHTPDQSTAYMPVSYTHLTLPTTERV